ncbi:hypothetical protein BDU57DRAFT_540877 [Ampelomyces quisqualis]|uniref:GST N-terminal domain-containing protein n=1 Tax=Ampelomyces quisqualis TaxID=50730 RepID=A0A6A5QFA5_AMPQU|nr:hypothetical protein BDU57DRAFT_540877 [Ampelomyces quisqualis]
MANKMLKVTPATEDIGFIKNDPLNIKAGDQVRVIPSDYGQVGVSTGTLIGLSTKEVVIKNDKNLHLHFPRWNFSIKILSNSTPSAPFNLTKPKKPSHMRLIYHPRLTVHPLAKHIPLEKAVVCSAAFPGWSDNNADVSVYNPLTKVPCLVPNDVPDGVFDSQVMCEYLETLANVSRVKDARYWQLRTLHVCADGIMDAEVLLAYEVRIRKQKGLLFEEWVEGQKQKIVRGLDWLEGAANSGVLPEPGNGPASADEVAVTVATAITGQMGCLGIQWKEGRQKLAEWMAKWEVRASFANTPPTQDWESVGDGRSILKI